MTAAKAYHSIERDRLQGWANEEELRLSWLMALSQATGQRFDAERFRHDASLNNVIIEFKGPGAFGGSKQSLKFIEATEERLLPYIRRFAAHQNAPVEDYIGIAIDGSHICFAQVKSDPLAGAVIESQHLIPFSPYAVELVIGAINAQWRRPVSTDNLMHDFGHGSADVRAFMQGLADALASRLAAPAAAPSAAQLAAGGDSADKIVMLFEEWQSLYGQVADISRLQAEALERELPIRWNGPRALSIPGRLFVLHSYNSLLMKLLAAEIISGHGLTALRQPAQEMAAVDDDARLLARLAGDIEGSALFAQAGILGFVEEAMFSWYLDLAAEAEFAPAILPPLRRILTALSLYRTDRLTHTRDVLRDLYQALVPGRLRQSLGEFYTPDWLVEHTISRADPGEGPWLGRRVLDPTCGSGSFLLAVIRRKKAEAEARGLSAAETLRDICSGVWGFDLNPLAVQTARVNYLMEIADLLREAAGEEVEIPVLLADAIYAPTDRGADVVHYTIGARQGRLDIALPAALVRERQRLDRMLDEMARHAARLDDFDRCRAGCLRSGLASEAEMLLWDPPLRASYDQVLALHQRQWHGFWFRIIRNFFWSASAGRFDLVLGNPPWVRWSKLPDAYRERVKPTCEHYGIFSSNRRHGGNELDISAMITWSVADKWLAEAGRIAFVITGTLFKNPSSEGFRKFRIEPGNPQSACLLPRLVDDLRQLKPFADASNHTAVVVLDKGPAPWAGIVPYYDWHPGPGARRAIRPDAPLAEVMAGVEIRAHEATPVGAPGSPWAVLAAGRAEVLQKLAGRDPQITGRKGITTDLNGVYFVRPLAARNGLVQVESRPEAGKKDIGSARQAWVEEELLYPLVKGAGDFEAFYHRADAEAAPRATGPGARPLAFVPNTGITGPEYQASERQMNQPELRRSRGWFAHYRYLLEERSTYRRQMAGAPYFAIYNVGAYSFAPWKVIWPEMSTRFYAAVAGQALTPSGVLRPYIPDHKVYFAAFDAAEPAFFLCALLNAPMVREWVEAHNVSIQVGDVFKHMRLPVWQPGDAAHEALAALAQEAHRTSDDAARVRLIADLAERAEALLAAWEP